MESKDEKKSRHKQDFNFMSYDEFVNIFNRYTKNNMCIVKITTGFEGRPWKSIFWAKEKDPGNFKMECKEIWEGKIQ